MQKEVVAPQDVKLGLVPQQIDGKVIVKDVSQGAWADEVGIKAGARIKTLNGLPVHGISEADLKAALKQRPLKILFEQDMLELHLQDPAEKLGCAFAGTPPASTSVSKVAPSSVAERHNIQPGFQLLAVNGRSIGDLTETTFRESLKGRPVSLLFQVPKKDEPLGESSKAPESSDVFEVLLEDAATKIGCGFAGVPPDAVAVGKVSPGTFAERNKIQTGYLLVSLNGIEMKELNPDRFREILKARPVRLRLQIPQSEEKEKIVKEVVKQENAVIAMQAIARGQRFRKQLRARIKQKAEKPSSVLDLTLDDANTKLGCGFAGIPPDSVRVGKVSPGTFAERNKIQTGYLLVSLNGIEMKELNPDRFREILKARPVRLCLEMPPSEEKEKIVKEVVKQENAVIAMQAIARGQRFRKQLRARIKQKTQTEAAAKPDTGPTTPATPSPGEVSEAADQAGEAGLLNFFVDKDEERSLGLDFDTPPVVVVRKVQAGSWAEGRVSVNSQIITVNGKATTALDAAALKVELDRRPLQLQIQPGVGPTSEVLPEAADRGPAPKSPEVKVEGHAESAQEREGDVPQLVSSVSASQDMQDLSKKLQEKEKELVMVRRELAKANEEVQELRARLTEEPQKKETMQDGSGGPGNGGSSLEEVKRQLSSALQELELARQQAAEVPSLQAELRQRSQELEDARKEVEAKLEHEPRGDHHPSKAPPQSPDSVASFDITPAYWEHVEIQALQEELSQKDEELKALKVDLAAAYAKLKDGDNKLRVTVPKSVTTLGFRLEKWLVYEVVKGSWAESVGLHLGDRLQMVQQMQVKDVSKKQMEEAFAQRPLQLIFRVALKQEKEAAASTKIQANWRRKKAKDKVHEVKGKRFQGDVGPELDALTVVADGDMGFKLEIWPPAPKVLVRSVQRNSWAMKVGIKAGYQLLMVQKQPIESFQDRQSFRRLWQERPLELTLCPGSKEDVERIASSTIQNGWRSRQMEPKGVETAINQATGPVAPASTMASSMVSPRLQAIQPELKQLQDELMSKDLELRKLKQDLARSESSFQKSLTNISNESSNSAVELASLKAQLAVEQSKVAKIQSEGSTKVTSAQAKLVVEQKKAETLEARLVEAEVIHQEQLNEITAFLEARRQELQLEEIDFSKLYHPSGPNPNAAQEVERLRAALAEEQERVSSAERKLVKGWSDQRAIDVKWQAEVSARDEKLEEMQKEVAKAEWWASLSSSPQLKDLGQLKTELEEEQAKTLRVERKLNEAQANVGKSESEKLQASLRKEEARGLHLQITLTRAQIKDQSLRKAAAGLEVQLRSVTDQDVTRNDLLQMNLQLQQLKDELQTQASSPLTMAREAPKRQVESPSKRQVSQSFNFSGVAAPEAPVKANLSRSDSSASRLSRSSVVRGRASLNDDSLRTRLALALMGALHSGGLREHLDKAKTVPRSEVRALKQEVIRLRRQVKMTEDSDSSTPRKSILRTRPASNKNTPKVRVVDEGQQMQVGKAPSEKPVLPDDLMHLTEEKARLTSELQREKAERLAHEQELRAEVTAARDARGRLLNQTKPEASEDDKAKLTAELERAKAKIKDYEEEISQKAHQKQQIEDASRTEEQKSAKAVHLNELAAKDSLLKQALEEKKSAEEEHEAEKERWRQEVAETQRELRQLQNEKARPLDVQEEVTEARQLRFSVEMQETVAADLRKQLWEVREQLEVAESMGWQPNKALTPEAPAESAMGQALRQEQELAKHLHQELSEVETAAITTAEAAEARIIQIETMDRRGRMALHMAETAAEKEAVLKDDAIKAACEAEAKVEGMRREVQQLNHEVYEQSQAVYRESAVCDGLRRALMNSVEEEMAQEALAATATVPTPPATATTTATPAAQPPSPRSPRSSPSVPQLSSSPPRLGGIRAYPSLAAGPTAAFASRLSNREDLKHDLMSPSEVKSWMDPSTISQPSLLSAAAKEAASLRKEAEQLRHEVRHWRASRPVRADPTPPAGDLGTPDRAERSGGLGEASRPARPDAKVSRKSREEHAGFFKCGSSQTARTTATATPVGISRAEETPWLKGRAFPLFQDVRPRGK